jgi:hypothetical protein
MWALIILAGVIALILFVPVRLRLLFAGPGRPAWAAEVSWAGGCLGAGWSEDGRYLYIGRLRWTPAAESPAPAAPEPGGERIRRLWREATAERRRAFGRLMAAAWKGLDFSARGTIVYGFADPALTAWLHGLVCALGPGKEFSAEADFSREGWEGDIEVVCSLRLWRVWWPAVRLATVHWRTRKSEGGEKIWQVQA